MSAAREPETGDSLPVLVAKAALALNALAAFSPDEADGVARAFLSGLLTPLKERRILPWQNTTSSQ